MMVKAFKRGILLWMLLMGLVLFMPSLGLDLHAEEATNVTAPSNFSATVTQEDSDKYVKLSWSYDSPEYVISIERSDGDSNSFHVIENYYCNNPGTTYYTDYPEEGVPHYYRAHITSIYTYDEEYYYGYTTPVSGPYTPVIKCILPLNKPEIDSLEAGNSKSVTIKWKKQNDADGYAIYRKKGAAGEFQHVKTVGAKAKTTWTYENGESKELYSFTEKGLVLGAIYFYKVVPYVTYNGKKYYSSASDEKSVQTTINKTKIIRSSSTRKRTNTIKWKKVSAASGYMVYVSTKMNGKFKKIKTLKKNSKTTFTHKKLTNGKAYYYKIVAYRKTANGTITSESDVYMKFCSYYGYDRESYEARSRRIFGKNYYSGYSSAAEASSHMKTISIRVWDMNSAGIKYPKTVYLTVNEKIAPTVKQMFSEIFKSKERIPIHAIGGYSWRGGRSEHNEGLAIDINPVENYMIDDGVIQAGSFWSPKTNPYSIPLKCDMVKIMRKYGFYRGFWGNRKDYMHFSYFGT